MLFQQRILIVGAAGKSGQAAAELCLALGAYVYLHDESPALAVSDFMQAAQQAGREFEILSQVDALTLEHRQIDLAITAPGIPLTHPLLVTVREQGITLRGELDLAAEILEKIYNNSETVKIPLVVITGTDGKSTTTRLLCDMLSAGGKLPATPAGNFGLPLSHVARLHLAGSQGQALMGKYALPASVLQIGLDDDLMKTLAAGNQQILVAECSSFQLELVQALHPMVAILLNLADDHLDRYVDLNNYLQAKLNFLINMREKDLVLAPPVLLEKARARIARDEYHTPRLQIAPTLSDFKPAADIYYQDQVLLPAIEYARPGLHDRINLEFALACLADLEKRLDWLQVDREALSQALRNFKGLPHRMELVANKNYLKYFNDSKATTVQAIEAALAGFKDTIVYLLLGGRAKGADFGVLRRFEQVNFYCYGASGALIADALKVKTTYPDLAQAFVAANADATVAVNARADQANSSSVKPQDLIVLLSPGCASFDAYQNFEKRGEHFRELVNGL